MKKKKIAKASNRFWTRETGSSLCTLPCHSVWGFDFCSHPCPRLKQIANGLENHSGFPQGHRGPGTPEHRDFYL